MNRITSNDKLIEIDIDSLFEKSDLIDPINQSTSIETNIIEDKKDILSDKKVPTLECSNEKNDDKIQVNQITQIIDSNGNINSIDDFFQNADFLNCELLNYNDNNILCKDEGIEVVKLNTKAVKEKELLKSNKKVDKARSRKNKKKKIASEETVNSTTNAGTEKDSNKESKKFNSKCTNIESKNEFDYDMKSKKRNTFKEKMVERHCKNESEKKCTKKNKKISKEMEDIFGSGYKYNLVREQKSHFNEKGYNFQDKIESNLSNMSNISNISNPFNYKNRKNSSYIERNKNSTFESISNQMSPIEENNVKNLVDLAFSLKLNIDQTDKEKRINSKPETYIDLKALKENKNHISLVNNLEKLLKDDDYFINEEGVRKFESLINPVSCLYYQKSFGLSSLNSIKLSLKDQDDIHSEPIIAIKHEEEDLSSDIISFDKLVSLSDSNFENYFSKAEIEKQEEAIKMERNLLVKKHKKCYIREYKNKKFFNYFPCVGVGVLCVDEKREKILIGRRIEGNMLSLPGGWIENGETWEEAASRELFEETGIMKSPQNFTHIYTLNYYNKDKTFHSISCVMYTVVSDEDYLQLVNKEPDKCFGWYWLSLKDIKNVIKELFAPLRAFIMKYNNILKASDFKSFFKAKMNIDSLFEMDIC